MASAIAIIINGISRKKKKFYRDIYPDLAKRFSIEVFETQESGHAVELALNATEKGFDFIVAAGGDGTLNQLVNGVLLSSRTTLPALGLIPLGTGNDFARMCGLSPNPQSLIRLLETNEPKPVDIGRLVCRDSNGATVVRYFINACSIGMGPAVVKRLEKSSRSLGPFLTYWKAITATFLTHRPQEIHCITNTWEWRGKVRVLAIANGQSFGNSIYIAPDAVPDDGILDAFIAGDLSLLKFLLYQQALKRRKKVVDDRIFYRTSDGGIKLSAPESCAIETEGELAGFLPAEIELVSAKIHFLR